MPVPAATVVSAIRLLLDREPVNGEEVLALAHRCTDLGALRRELLASEEFERRHPDLARAEAPATVIVPLEDGVRVVVDLADHAVGIPIARRAFERNELEFVARTVRTGQHVVDGGAHAGLFALTMARAVGAPGSVHAFEPVARHAAWLEAGVSESGADRIVRVVRAALANRSGRGEMVVAERTVNPGASWLRPPASRLPHGHRAEPVPTVALDDLELQHPVSFIRLDIEGAEGRALGGARRLLASDRPILLVEVHADRHQEVSGVPAAEMFANLRALGYRAHALGAGTVETALDALPRTGTHPVVFLP